MSNLRIHLPNRDGCATIATNEETPIRANCYIVDFDCTFVEPTSMCTRWDRPKANGFVIASTGEDFTIGTDCYATDWPLMAGQSAEPRPFGSSQSLIILS